MAEQVKEQVKEQDRWLAQIAKIMTPYSTSPPSFCYPGTILPDVFGTISKQLTPLQINNIGTHTYGITSDNSSVQTEGGFDVPHQMEKEYVWWIARMFAKHDPMNVINLVDGYFCGGGTEGNIEGLWIGRQWLKETPDHIGLLLSPLTHYSVVKGAHILEINKHIKYAKTNEKFEMDINDIKCVLESFLREGITKIIIVGTIGTTVCGSIDNIKEISYLIDTFPKMKIYFHIDASFGGFTAPFVDEQNLYGFENRNVQSIVVDGDKMGMLPYPSGIFLCRKGLQDNIKIDVPYVGSHMDMTISGSRTFVSVACGWYYINTIGTNGHKQMVAECIAKRNDLAKKLTNVRGVTVLPYSEYTNILPISTPFEVSSQMDPNYNMRYDLVDYHGKSIIIYKLCIFPHVFNYIDRFVRDLDAATNS